MAGPQTIGVNYYNITLPVLNYAAAAAAAVSVVYKYQEGDGIKISSVYRNTHNLTQVTHRLIMS